MSGMSEEEREARRLAAQYNAAVRRWLRHKRPILARRMKRVHEEIVDFVERAGRE